MNNPIIENVLNLALDATPQERARSENLDVGFDSAEKTWELIVKYSGPLDELQQAGITVTELLNEYAVLLVPENLVELLAGVPEIEYIEKPKRLFFSVNQGKTASCITAVQSGQYGLYGEGVLVALMQGIKRGLFSNEAGMGSAPNVAATAHVSHPVKQGLIQTLGVFTDRFSKANSCLMCCLLMSSQRCKSSPQLT